MWCNVMYCNVMYAYFLILLHHWHILPGLTIHIAQNIGTPARWAQARGPGRRTRVAICRNSCRNEPRLFPSSWYEITQKMYGSNEPGFLGWYLKPKSWGEGNTKSYQRNIDLMWFVVSQAIRFFFFRRYCGIHSWVRWLNQQKWGVKPLVAHILPDLPRTIGIERQSNKQVTSGNGRNHGQLHFSGHKFARDVALAGLPTINRSKVFNWPVRRVIHKYWKLAYHETLGSSWCLAA